MDYLFIGSSPSEEDCAQVGSPHYAEISAVELREFRRMLAEEFPSIQFKIKWQSHDFGRYGEVVACYDEDDEEQSDAAIDAECHFDYWDDVARAAIAAVKESLK